MRCDFYAFFKCHRSHAYINKGTIHENDIMLNNYAFHSCNSATKDGEFKVVNMSMIQGAGTTGERNEYVWTDSTAKPNTVYYYRIEDVSHAGVRQQLATVRLRRLMSAGNKLIQMWGDLKTLD